MFPLGRLDLSSTSYLIMLVEKFALKNIQKRIKLGTSILHPFGFVSQPTRGFALSSIICEILRDFQGCISFFLLVETPVQVKRRRVLHDLKTSACALSHHTSLINTTLFNTRKNILIFSTFSRSLSTMYKIVYCT